MADNLPVTPGAGASIATDQASGDASHVQIVKLAYSADGEKTAVLADADGLEVQIAKSVDLTTIPKAGEAWPVTDNGGALSVDDNAASLTVDAPASSPVAVRLSTGAAFIDTIPVSDNNGSLTVDDGGGSLTIDGTVGVVQSTPGPNSSAWPVKISDGTDIVGISTVSGAKAAKVDVIQSSLQQADKTSFVEGTGKHVPVGAVYNDTIAGDPTEDQAAALRMTAKRGLHVNLRNLSGTEIGTSGAPLRVDPTGTTKQGANLFDETGAAFSESNPLPVSVVRGEQTRVTKSVAITASQTGTAIWTPAGGKKFVIVQLMIALSVGGDLTVFDGTDSEGNRLTDGTMPVGYFFLPLARPFASSTADNVLKYTTGINITGKITVHGYEV